MFVMDSNLACKISRKDLLCTKILKNGYREFGHYHMGTLGSWIFVKECILRLTYSNSAAYELLKQFCFSNFC